MTNPDDWDRHWRDYADTAEQNPAQNYRREIILSLLDITGAGEDSRIIDIGSGQGDMAAAIRARFPGAEILGLELSEAGVEISRRKVSSARFVQRNLLDGTAPPEEQRGWGDSRGLFGSHRTPGQPRTSLEERASVHERR